MTILRVWGEVKFIGQFQCRKCGGIAAGMSETVQLEAASLSDVTEQLAKVTPTNFPVGWSSFYAPRGTVYECPDCIKEQKLEILREILSKEAK